MHTVRLHHSSRLFQVGKIVCVARNYSEHVRELHNRPVGEPVFFLKPASSIIRSGETAVIPPYSRNCHHEVELAVLIGKWGRNIREEEALQHIAGYGVAIDLTLRDVQEQLKAEGLPWDKAKGFDTSCPLSDFMPAAAVADPSALHLSLTVNGELRQSGNSGDMIYPPATLISAASRIFALERGDILLTGTPAGVGPVLSGDQVTASIKGVGAVHIRVH